MDSNQVAAFVHARTAEFAAALIADLTTGQGIPGQPPFPQHPPWSTLPDTASLPTAFCGPSYQDPSLWGMSPYSVPVYRPRPGVREKEHALRTAGKQFAARCCVDEIPETHTIVVPVTDTVEVDGFVFTTLQFARNYDKKFSRRVGSHYHRLGYTVQECTFNDDNSAFIIKVTEEQA
jgi:hypothetical protein